MRSGSVAARTAGVCLAVATTDSFLPGALVTIGSFLERHPRFAGDVVVIHDGLCVASRGILAALSDRLRLRRVGTGLRERLARLPADFTPRRRAQFHSLDAFRLTGYRKVLLCDADLLFREPVDDLFDSEADLLCCGDGAHLRGRRRDAVTFAYTCASDALGRTFNSGFLLIDARLLGERSHADLLALVSPETWRGAATPHTDQFVLNRHFAGQQTLVGWNCNYLLGQAREIRAREDLHWRAARVLHFNLPAKPWMPHALLRSAAAAGPAEIALAVSHADILPAFKLWHDAWLDCVAGAHLRSVGRARGAEKATERAS